MIESTMQFIDMRIKEAEFLPN